MRTVVTLFVFVALILGAAPAFAGQNETVVPAEPGMYGQTGNDLVALPEETAKRSKGPSPLKMMMSGGFAPMSTKMSLAGAKSSVQMSGPVTIFVRFPRGMSPSDLQLVVMEAKDDSREVTAAKMSFLKGMTANPGVDVEFEKVEDRVYKTTLNLTAGEYGFGLTRGGPMFYTFSVQ